MEVIVVAAVYLLLLVVGSVLLWRWDKEVEDHSKVEGSWKAADDEKQKQAKFWSDQFQEAARNQDLAKILSLGTTEIKILGDEANTLTRLGMKIDLSLYHLRYRSLALERLTKPLIIGTILLYLATVPLAVESTVHLIERFQARFTPELKVTFPVPPAPVRQ
jgi:hypothetical protein